MSSTIGFVHLRDHAPYTNLPAQGLPMEAEGGFGIGLEFFSFFAFRIGKEAKAAAVDPLYQYHAHAGYTVGCGGCQGCGVGVVWFAFLRLLEPCGEKIEWIREQEVLA